MATYISKKTGRREVGGQPPLPCTPPRIRTGDEIHLPFRVAYGLASWQILHDEWCQEIECNIVTRPIVPLGKRSRQHNSSGVAVSATYSWRLTRYRTRRVVLHNFPHINLLIEGGVATGHRRAARGRGGR